MTLNSDIAERGVEVLARLGRMKASLADASFIATWAHDARNALRAPLAALPTGDLVALADTLASSDVWVAEQDVRSRPRMNGPDMAAILRSNAAHIQALTAERDGLEKWKDELLRCEKDQRELRFAAEARVKVLEAALATAREAIASVHETTFGEGNMGGLSDPYPLQAELLYAIDTALNSEGDGA